MSFGGSKNPPWQRNSMTANGGQQGIPNIPTQMNLINSQIVGYPPQNQQFNQQIGLSTAPQQNMSIISQISGSIPNQIQSNNLFSQAVSYPVTRTLNTLNFTGNNTPNQQPQSSSQIQHRNTQTQQIIPSQMNQNTVSTSLHQVLQANLSKNLRYFSGTGTVTKIQNEFGFVEDEIYFHKNVCINRVMPKIGDRVLVEANYNMTMPFKWNATRIQFLQCNQQLGTSSNKTFPSLLSIKTNCGPGPTNLSNDSDHFNNHRRNHRNSPTRVNSPDQRYRESKKDLDNEENDRKRRRNDVESDRHRDRDYNYDKRDRSPMRKLSPKRRKTRVVPRYMVQIPKVNLAMTEADVLELQRRYSNLYVPSDFFLTKLSWVDAFPIDTPFSINKPCSFHIMHKDAIVSNNIAEPNDADYLFSAKVMLMGVPPITEIYRKCFAMAEEKDRDEREFVHPTRLINFLVGMRAKNETMAIGGPWSKSLDGENPMTDNSVLIKTAIRNCKLLTGIDLSHCTQWYKFVELYYRRSETMYKGRLVPSRVETVVIYLPDISSCIPTLLEWDGIQSLYKTTLEKVIKQESLEKDLENQRENKEKSENDSGNTENENTKQDNEILTDKVKEEKIIDANENINELSNKLDTTHSVELDIKNMKVNDLRDKLIARNLSAKGLRAQLIARLSKALKNESISKDEGSIKSEEDEQVVEGEKELIESSAEIEENKETTKEIQPMSTKESQTWERRYTIPSTPHIIVHPSKIAKSGKFDCKIMSLSVLLDYRPEDTKEHSFEVSLFAELFNEMLMRDFGFRIYRSLYTLPDKLKTKNKLDDQNKKDEKCKILDDKDSLHEQSPDDEISKNENDGSHSKDKNHDRDSITRRRSRQYDDDNSDDDSHSTKSNDKKKKTDRSKYYTAYPDLLLSFVYFDQTHCGYIFEKDIEDLFYTLGLNISRAQSRKLIGKVVTRASFNYRKLTDLPKLDDENKIQNEENNEDKLDENVIREMIQGNKSHLPNFKCLENEYNSSNEINNKEIPDSINGITRYKGGVINLENILSQLKRSEKARDDIEKLLVDLRKKYSELHSNFIKSQSKVKDLNLDIKNITRKLNTTEDKLNIANKQVNEYYSILSNINEKIKPILTKNERSICRPDQVSDVDESQPTSDQKNITDKEYELSCSVKTDKELN